MTRSEWDAAMVRYMHRSDLSADLDQVFDYATSKIENAWMRKNVLSGTTPMFNSADDMLAYAPLPYLHAGLMYFQELVQDDEGMMREMTRFSDEMSTVQHKWSRDNVTPRMEVSYAT